MRSTKYILWMALCGGIALMGHTFTGQATLKYRKETGKKCIFCHTGIPKAGAEDPQLTKEGKKFRDNGHKLTDEQKTEPGAN